MIQTAIFAAGCFWSAEDFFLKVPGVIDVTPGYTGGMTSHPSYEAVCRGDTGHAEAVKIEFDDTQISYRQLLEIFWENHDPTTLNRQGPDVGTQYRSAVFCLDSAQAVIAQEMRDALQRSGRYNDPVVTSIEVATEFFPAEAYHRRYCQRHGISHHPKIPPSSSNK